MIRAAVLMFASCTLLATGSRAASDTNVQFSAETVQSSPDNKLRHTLVYVGDNQVRLEYHEDNQVAVNIYDMKNGRAIVLAPEQKTYMIRQVPRGQLDNPITQPRGQDPCAGIKQVSCRRLASDTLYDRPVVQWEMTWHNPGDREVDKSHLWFDAERQMPLRQVWSDGSIFEMRLIGKEQLNGRSTERWESVKTGADGASTKSLQWYDPQLRLTIREELPGGYFRELRNIKVGTQADSLFTVPQGYRPARLQRGEEGQALRNWQQPADQYPENRR